MRRYIATGRVLIHSNVLLAGVGQLAVRVDRDQHVADRRVDQLAVEARAEVLGDLRVRRARHHHQVVDALSKHAKHLDRRDGLGLELGLEVGVVVS